ncbi:hypothetical protein [Labilibaculum manganireducens]|uniref:hypothetical protein n=1 Tax=Labilibaculum manganireducens TaxID=1940525 RepID=UPI0029F4E696|nr:hypothetical protein [Labilibaculum manganireducens]
MIKIKKVVSLIEDNIGSLEKDEKDFLENLEDKGWISKDRICLRAIVIKWLLLHSEEFEYFKNKVFYVNNVSITGQLDIEYLKVDFPLVFIDCHFESGINLMISTIKSLFLLTCEVEKLINLTGARIDGQFNCRGTLINGSAIDDENGDKYSVIADNLIVTGNVFFNLSDKKPFVAKEEVSINGIQISGTLDCSGSFFEKGINAQSAQIKQSVFMRDGFKASGEIDLLGAYIKGSLDCGSGIFNNPNGIAIKGSRMMVDGTVFFDAYKDDENTVGKNIRIDGIVDFKGAEITKSFKLKSVEKTDNYKLNLTNAFIHTLEDENTGWPPKGNLILDGFIFENISNESPRKHEERLKWLGLQKKETEFTPQPYRQLANVLDNLGLEKDAREIRIAMNNEIRNKSQKWKQKFWLGFSGMLIGYGYKPFKVLKFALVIWLLGTLFYIAGDEYKLIQPPSKFAYKNYSDSCKLDVLEPFDYYPKFNPLVYSLDVFLPIVNLHQEENWRPVSNKKDSQFYEIFNIKGGGLLNLWMYFQILSGWFLTTMLVGGISGLVRDK